MTIEKINKIYLIAPKSHRDTIMEHIQNLGMVQITDMDVDEENKARDIFSRGDMASVTERRTKENLFNQVINAIAFLEQYIPPRSGLSLLTRGPLSISRELENKVLDEFDFRNFILELKDRESRIKKLHVKKMSLENRREHLVPWKELDIPMSYFCRTKHTRIRALSVPASNADACRNAAEELIDALFSMKLGETRGEKNIIVIYHKDVEEAAEKVMRDFDVRSAVFPCEPLTPAESLQVIERDLEDIRKQVLHLESEIRGMAENLRNLRVIANHLDNWLERKRAKERGAETANAFVIKGWLPEKNLDELVNTVHSASPEADISVTDPEEGDDVPIILRNPPLFRPFESILDIYGKPSYHEFDPTISIALFFFISFGYCLTDAGYGLMLALIFGYAAWKLKVAPNIKKFFFLLTLCGISGLIMGILTGSWFGNLFTDHDLPTARLGWGNFISRFQLIDPLGKHIMLFLGGALGLGYIQLVWGVLIKTADLFRKRRFGEIIFDTLPWLFFTWGVAVSFFLKMPGYGMCLLGLLMILLFAGRDHKNILLRLVVGLGTIYNTVTGLLSDVLSYSRLFALGLATGIMATVINIMAFLLWTLPFAGWLLTVLTLLVAHPVNLAINVLGAFIHTSRLQFVEFFPKFFESGGQKFEAFCIKDTYIHIRDDEVNPTISD
ncbi:V-type ATP synthase subunit I [Candidatus Sumerlaeota bacterium]|nr:V-type ATP synthase subunit I [Candidatus Sumerlaeota bacterium]